MARNTTANRQYLAEQAAAGAWKPTKPLSEYSPAVINRKAAAFRSHEALGLAPSNLAARGHATTKEHPTRQRTPALTQYKNVARRAGQPIARERFGGGGLGPRRRPPLRFRHTPPGTPLSAKTTVRGTGTYLVFGGGRPNLVLDPLRAYRGSLVAIEGYDCGQRRWGKVQLEPQTSIYQPAQDWESAWHRARSRGVSFAEWLRELLNAADSPRAGGGGFDHICWFQMTIFQPNIATAG